MSLQSVNDWVRKTLRGWFRTKSIADVIAEAEPEARQLKKVLGPVHLTLLGIGGIIGAGIFGLVGTAAAGDEQRLGAGPALAVSFALTGIACSFSAFCYAEFASRVPIAGSAYTYAYTSFGKVVAWIIGWDLLLEYAVGNIAVAVSWSGYFCEFLRGFHWNGQPIEFPKWLATDLRTALATPEILESAPTILGVPIIFNLPAVFIVVALTIVLVIGIRESAWFNAVMVFVKLLVLGFFVAVGCWYVKPENWTPFAPNGWLGIQMGAATVFFAYIGFDAVSTAAEECRNPKRDLPIGILASLAICTLIYVVVAVVLTGMVPWKSLNTAEPLSVAMRVVDQSWAAGIVAFGSVIAHTAVLLIFQLGQPRILFSMARDGLLPGVLAKTHPRFKTPHVATILVGIFVAVGAALASLEEMADLCSIGTLSAFVIVCAGVPLLRRQDGRGARPPGFRTPWSPWIPLLGVATCLWLMFGLPVLAWVRFGIWLVAGLALFVLYGSRRSRLAQRVGRVEPAGKPHQAP